MFTEYTTNNGLPSNDVRDVIVDVVTIDLVEREVVWAATAAGLVRIDVSIPSLTTITTSDGLSDDSCFSVVVDPTDHAKYIGTGAGLEVYRGQ